MNGLHLIDASTIDRKIRQEPHTVLNIVENAYKAHWLNRSVCPPSVFLRLPGGNRIIALPACVNDDEKSAAGIKWIASFPGNVASGLDRASALIVLNDLETGYATAILEGGAISAARTGAFAALACRALLRGLKQPTLAIIGCGRISRTTLSYLKLLVDFAEVRVFDLVGDRAAKFVSDPLVASGNARNFATLEQALAGSDVALFATTASEPYIHDAAILADCKLLLHVSLRDISEQVLTELFNVSDDRDHVLREHTSLHRLSLLRTDVSAVDAELGDILWGEAGLPVGKPIAFSPFGLGVLDIALASHIFTKGQAEGTTTVLSSFYDSAH